MGNNKKKSEDLCCIRHQYMLANMVLYRFHGHSEEALAGMCAGVVNVLDQLRQDQPQVPNDGCAICATLNSHESYCKTPDCSISARSGEDRDRYILMSVLTQLYIWPHTQMRETCQPCQDSVAVLCRSALCYPHFQAVGAGIVFVGKALKSEYDLTGSVDGGELPKVLKVAQITDTYHEAIKKNPVDVWLAEVEPCLLCDGTEDSAPEELFKNMMVDIVNDCYAKYEVSSS